MGAYFTEEGGQQHFEEFYEDVFVDCQESYGKIKCMYVCDNVSRHLDGNVYIKVNITLSTTHFQLVCVCVCYIKGTLQNGLHGF